MPMKLERTKKGLPAVWESGGGSTNTGFATIIADSDGSPKKPLYIKLRGELSCSDHALFVVHEGDVVINADHHRGDFSIRVNRIENIKATDDGFAADLSTLAEYTNGEWSDDKIAEYYSSAIGAAIKKATCYHCREPHYYVREEVKNNE